MSNIETIEDLLARFINNWKGSSFSLNDFYKWLESENLIECVNIHKAKGYLEFYNAINSLCVQARIEPVKSSTTNGVGDGKALKNKYRILKEKVKIESQEEVLRQLISYDRRIPSIKYYQNHLDEFIKDKLFIDIIYQFLGKENVTELSIHERSWQLFKDEKFIYNADNGTRGGKILNNLGLTYSDLKCYRTYEPFVYFRSDNFNKKDVKNILIVENRDTFWSLQKLIANKNNTLDVDLLVYGAGNKIPSSFQYLEQIDGLVEFKIFYFGDIDKEGLNIFVKLKREFGHYHSIMLHEVLYKSLLDTIVVADLKETKKEQQLMNDTWDVIKDSLSPEIFSRIEEVINLGYYVPQESLNYEIMLSLFGGS